MTWHNSFRRRWAVGLPLTILFLWAYWPTLGRVAQTWRSDPDYTHGFLVLPIAAAILLRRRRPAAADSGQDLGGYLLIGLAGLLRLVAARYYVPELEVWSIPVWIAGLLWLMTDWHTLRWAAPSIAFLWFAAPLPARIEQALSIPLQRQATALSAWTLQALGQPAVGSGTTILLGTHQLEIEHACSGLRMFMGTAALAVAFLLLTPPRRGKTILVIGLAAPVAILANVVRIVATGLLCQWASTSLAQRFAHDLAGIAMMLFAVASFGLIVYLAHRTHKALQQQRSAFVRRLAVWPLLVVAVALIGVLHHRSQLQRMESSLLQTALICERSGQWDSAKTYLEQYLQLVGDDAQAQRRLARAVEQTASRPVGQRRAMTVLRKAWDAHPDDLEFADSLAELALELREYDQVIETTDAILKHARIHRPEMAMLKLRAARYRAQALYDLLTEPKAASPYSWNQVIDALRDARRVDPKHVEHSFRLAVLYREKVEVPSDDQRNATADQIMEELAVRLPDSAEAWLARYLYRQRYHRPNDEDPELNGSIDADLAQAIRLDEISEHRNIHILIAAAERSRERGDLQQSLAYFETARQTNSQDIRPYLGISKILATARSEAERKRSIDVLEQGLDQIGHSEVKLIFPLIEQLVELGCSEQADEYRRRVDEIISVYPEPTQTTYRVQLLHVDAWRLARQSQFADAARLLGEGLSKLGREYTRGFSKYVAQSWANVAQYHRMAGDWQQAAAAYQRAASLDDTWQLEYRWVVARQKESRGNLDEAIREYEDLAADETDPAKAWIQAASTSLRQQLLLPAAQRDWTPFLRATAAARSVAGDRLDRVLVLQAHQMQISGQDQQVLTLLSDGLTQLPNSQLLRRCLALTQARLGQRQAALNTAIQAAGPDDRTDSILLQAQILCQLDSLTEAAELLWNSLETQDHIIPSAVQLRLAQVEMQRGQWERARSLLEEAARSAPSDVRVIDALGQLALCLQDWPLLEQCEAKLRMMEGDSGARWRTSRIEQMLARSSTEAAGPTDRVSADELAERLEREHPQRRATRIIAGHVAARRGRLWRAVANYEEAWQMDLPSVSLAVDLVGLLNELGQTAKAQQYVREVRQYLAATEQVIDPILLGWYGESADEAIRLAEAAVAQTAQAESAVRLGRTLVLTAMPGSAREAERLARAERAFARAVEWEPNNTRAWAAYFRFLIAVKADPVGSQRVLADLAEHDEISPLNRAFVLAQLHESMGNRQRADRLFHESLELIDANLPVAEQLVVLQRSAQYFSSHEPATAETCCRRALELDTKAPGAAQILIELLLARGTTEAIAEADPLLDAATADAASGDPLRRLRARIRLEAARHGNQEGRDPCGEAIELLQGIVHKTNEDLLRLADLYLLQKRYPFALEQLQAATRELPVDVDTLCSFLRRHQQQLHSDVRLRRCTERIYRMLEEQPDTMLTALDLQLEATSFNGPGFALGPHGPDERMIEQFIRRALTRTQSSEERVPVLTRILADLLQNGRGAVAVALHNRFPDLLPAPRAACGLAAALAVSPAEVLSEQARRQLIQQWLSDHPHDPELRFCVANLQLMRGDYGAAAELLRLCLNDNPAHVGTRNNLAMALAFGTTGQLAEAQELVTKAIQHAGQQPQLLDTLAVLYLRQGAPQNAVDVLLAMLADAPSDGLPLLHLSQAWLELGQTEMARYAFDMARSRHVDLLPLLPPDRLLLQQLDQQLNLE